MAKNRRYPGNIERHRDRWRVRFSIGGRRYRLMAPEGCDRREAEKFARAAYDRLREDHKQRELTGVVDSMRFSDLLDHFEKITNEEKCHGTRRSYRNSIVPIGQYFVAVLGDKLTLDKVRPAHIEDYLAWRRTNGRKGKGHKSERPTVSPRTRNKDRAVLHRLFEIAMRRDWAATNPVKRAESVKGDSREWTILTDAEYERLLSECAGLATGEDPRVWPPVTDTAYAGLLAAAQSGKAIAAMRAQLTLYALVLGETGMRCDSEALHVRWEDVFLGATVPYVRVVTGRDGHRTKTGKSREIRMSARLVSALREYFAAYRLGSPSPHIFHHAENGHRVRRMGRSFKAAALRAELSPSFRQHDLRHRWVTVRANAGEPIQDVQYEAGHARIETTMLYYKQSPVHLRRPLAETAPAKQAAASGA